MNEAWCGFNLGAEVVDGGGRGGGALRTWGVRTNGLWPTYGLSMMRRVAVAGATRALRCRD
eukprot:1423175-Prymnesium_polylepis.1